VGATEGLGRFKATAQIEINHFVEVAVIHRLIAGEDGLALGDARQMGALHLYHTPDDPCGSFWQSDTCEIASVRLSDRRME
jgi:hypothetical protein